MGNVRFFCLADRLANLIISLIGNTRLYASTLRLRFMCHISANRYAIRVIRFL